MCLVLFGRQEAVSAPGAGWVMQARQRKPNRSTGFRLNDKNPPRMNLGLRRDFANQFPEDWPLDTDRCWISRNDKSTIFCLKRTRGSLSISGRTGMNINQPCQYGYKIWSVAHVTYNRYMRVLTHRTLAESPGNLGNRTTASRAEKSPPPNFLHSAKIYPYAFGSELLTGEGWGYQEHARYSGVSFSGTATILPSRSHKYLTTQLIQHLRWSTSAPTEGARETSPSPFLIPSFLTQHPASAPLSKTITEAHRLQLFQERYRL